MYNQKLINTAAVAILSISSIPAQAIPAKPGPMQFKNGEHTITVYLHGDEHFHYYTSEDGYLLDYNNGRFTYASISADGVITSMGNTLATPSDVREPETRQMLAGIDRDRQALQLHDAALSRLTRRRTSPNRAVPAARVGLFPGCHFPSEGVQKALVVLVEYQDIKFTLADPLDYFDRLLNEPEFSDYGGTGSARDYFIENSGGKFLPEFDVIGPITLDRERAYYGGNNIMGDDVNAHIMVIEACQQLDATVDFSQYDRDNDGFIDNVFVFYAGRGENAGGPSESVWPHSYNITKASSEAYVFDGVQLDYYACTNEWSGSRPDGVGTFVHEFSHVMGLPDLYPTVAGSSAFSPGAWSAMDYGPYNNSGCTPPMYSAFERYALGWLDPVQIKTAQNATLPPIGDNVAGIIPTSSPHEFYLIENRQPTSWDSFIPGHGMLVWHVDYVSSVWSNNRVNNNANHQYVDLIEADNLKTPDSRNGDPFPGTARITSLTDDTTPSMRTWADRPLDTPLTDIAEDGDEVTFKVMGGREPIAIPHALHATDIEATRVTARWDKTDASQYRLDFYSKDADGSIVDPHRYYLGNTGSHTVEDLKPDTYYYYTVRACDALEMSARSEEIELFTGHLTIDNLTVESLPVASADITSDGFTARWLALDDATSYSITVYTKEPGDPYQDLCAFDNKLLLPDQWSTDATLTYSMSTWAGAAAPSLRMGADQSVTSPEYTSAVSGLSFWHRGSSTSTEDRIEVSVLADGQWTTAGSYPVITDKGGKITEVEAIPDGTHAVKITFRRTGTGSLALDDVNVSWGARPVNTPLAGYNNAELGDVTSHDITGLTPGTYYFTVTATDGTTVSHPSAEQEVIIADPAGIGTVTSSTAIWHLNGLNLTIDGACRYILTDIAGRTMAYGSGTATIALPVKGFYILKIDGQNAVKLLAR